MELTKKEKFHIGAGAALILTLIGAPLCSSPDIATNTPAKPKSPAKPKKVQDFISNRVAEGIGDAAVRSRDLDDSLEIATDDSLIDDEVPFQDIHILTEGIRRRCEDFHGRITQEEASTDCVQQATSILAACLRNNEHNCAEDFIAANNKCDSLEIDEDLGVNCLAVTAREIEGIEWSALLEMEMDAARRFYEAVIGDWGLTGGNSTFPNSDLEFAETAYNFFSAIDLLYREGDFQLDESYDRHLSLIMGEFRRRINIKDNPGGKHLLEILGKLSDLMGALHEGE